MANQRKDLPAGWTWRNGRPRLKFSPALRRAGWRDHDLKDAEGRFLARGPSIDRAESVAQAVARWRAGELVPAAFAKIAPPGAGETPGAGQAAPRRKLSIGQLLEDFAGDPDRKVPGSNEFRELAASTQRDYRGKLKRLVDVLAGYTILPGPNARPAELEAYSAAVAAAKGLLIWTLAPELTDDGDVVSDPLYDAYHLLAKHAGENQAAGVMAVASVWLSWISKRRNRKVQNWVKAVERRTPQGRIRPLSFVEVFALVEAADRLGYPSIGDSVILGVDLSWSQADRLDLRWNRLVDGRASTGQDGRKKTGRVGETPLLDGLGLARLPLIVARHAAMDAHPTHVLWCEDTGAPWKADHYRHKYAEVRAEAGKKVPSVLETTDQDLRDTAITMARRAGLSIEQTCSRTLQSRKRVLELWDRAYGEIGQEDADAGAVLLNAYLKERKVAL